MSASLSPLPSPLASQRLRRFRVDVGTIISAIVLSQSLLLVALGYWGSQRLVSTIGESAHRSDHERIQDKVVAFLAKATSVVDAMGDAPSLRPAGERSEQTAELLWTLLQQSPELDSVYVADDGGRMLMALRYPTPAIRRIVREADHATEVWEHKPPVGAGGDAQKRYATQRIEAYRSDYNPLARDWFRRATAARSAVWTQPYVFAAAQELGVTFALPSRRTYADGDARALVVAGDVTLGRLSEFVRLFSRTGDGDSALLSAEGMVLARSDRPGVVQALAAPAGGVLGAVHARMAHDEQARSATGAGFTLTHDDRRYLVRSSRIAGAGWQLISWVPEDKLLGGLQRAVLWALALVAVFLAVILGVSLRLAKLVTAPVEHLSRIARRIGRLELDNLPRETSRVLEIQHLDQALDESARSLKAFRKFVPVDVINQLIAEGHALAPNGWPRRITVMFTDVQGFTSISEALQTDVLVEQLTAYFNLAARVFARHGGTIDKFIGDGIMVLWGAPSDLDDAEYKACLAALELQSEMDQLNASWRQGGRPEFHTRVGLHTGVVIAGVLGANERLSYTAFGDVINVASRIEGINKDLGTRILMSEATFEGLRGRLATRRVEELAEIRGRQTRLVLYELTGHRAVRAGRDAVRGAAPDSTPADKNDADPSL
ncbi:MAG: adenylate/guanylate cyclase domain-containing protein [Variovorax sp.]|nr:MAG: adenylate/guanylate cyclase domain-containing protein [Variovorax sp.]